jgi:phospholipase D1/2
MSENMVSNVKKAANVVIKPAAILSQHNTVATSGAPKGDPSERQDYDVDSGKLTAGFASSVMPTLEERTIFQRRPSANHTDGKPLFDALDESGEQGESDDIPEAKVTDKDKKQMEGKPIDASGDQHGTSKAPKIAGPANEQDKFGVPANADKGDHSVPNKDIDRHEETEEEKLAVKARSTLRKHLSVKVGISPVSRICGLFGC